ncbi:MAG: hypothetical protein M0035_06270 [Actinomycetota bacterium]|nr:hypothetical protein [Actinomycetota bacterium]
MTERVVAQGWYLCAAARNLVRAGFAYSVIRLGPEMNRNWNCDSLGTTPVSWHAWADRFAAIVVSMRSDPAGTSCSTGTAMLTIARHLSARTARGTSTST